MEKLVIRNALLCVCVTAETSLFLPCLYSKNKLHPIICIISFPASLFLKQYKVSTYENQEVYQSVRIKGLSENFVKVPENQGNFSACEYICIFNLPMKLIVFFYIYIRYFFTRWSMFFNILNKKKSTWYYLLILNTNWGD